MEFKINKIEDWQQVIDKILPDLKHPILLLKGNLGAGKTTFTQLLLKRIGCKDEVSSPTYAIVNEYDTPQGIVYHFDLYRLNSVQEVEDIGIHEYLDHSFLSIIEWPEVYQQELDPSAYHEMSIENKGVERVINFR